MNEISIKDRLAIRNNLGVTSETTICNCSKCIVCVNCGLFPPAVVMSLSASVNINLNSSTGNTN